MEISIEHYNKMAERLTELEYKEAERQWIPCSERLPEKIEKDYWVCTDEDHHNWQCVCKWRKYPSKRGDFWAWHLNARVVAWMPLPEPYQEERAEKYPWFRMEDEK